VRWSETLETLNTNFPANKTFCGALNPGRWAEVPEEDLPDAIRVEHKRHIYSDGSVNVKP